jgi:cytochrome c peroxidase
MIRVWMTLCSFRSLRPTISGTCTTVRIGSLPNYLLYISTNSQFRRLPSGSFDHTAADRRRELFSGKARCSSCHADPIFTEPGWNMHKASEVCVDDFQANRAPDHAYRTTPRNGLWIHTKRGFYYDGRFATLADVVNHYDSCFILGLTAQEQRDVVEYMKSLPRRK